MNLVHVLRETSLPDGLDVVSLPDWLARACGEATGLGHPTMLAGTALYDLDAARASGELLALVRDLTGRTVRLGAPAEAGAVAGAGVTAADASRSTWAPATTRRPSSGPVSPPATASR